MKGIILCGGKSTRLPLKLFLSDKTGWNIVLAAGRTLIRGGLRESELIFCLNEEADFLRGMIKYCFRDAKLLFDRHAGLRIINSLNEDRVVLCGDNVYGETTEKAIKSFSWVHSAASVNRLVEPTEHLDFWTGRKWSRRSLPWDKQHAALTTPWFLKGDIKIGDNVIDTLNFYSMKPVFIDDPDWHDLGTSDSVRAYYENHETGIAGSHSTTGTILRVRA